MPTKPTTIDEYLAGLSAENRGPLQKVRQAVRAAAPKHLSPESPANPGPFSLVQSG